MSKKYNDRYYARYGDPRTADWLFMDSQWYPIIFGAVYHSVTRLILPIVLPKNNPLKLCTLTVAFNFGMMLLNSWVFYELASLTFLKPDFNRTCQSIDWSNSEEGLRAAEMGWIFFLTTLLEYFITILMILRKPHSNISRVHTFLRIQAPIATWYGLKFAPGGYNSLYTLLNAFINAITHFHHAAVISMPFFKHPHWETVTLALIYVIQFSTVFIYYSQLYFFPPKNCKLSFFILRLNIVCAILFFIFAKNFFVSIFKKKDDRMSSSKKFK